MRFTSAVRIACLLASIWLSTSAMSAGASQIDRGIVDIPRIGNITIDGRVADWGGRGFQVALTRVVDGSEHPDDGFQMRFRLGWNDQGLLVFYEIRDQDISEAKTGEDIVNFDGVTIQGSEYPEQSPFTVRLSPGINPRMSKPNVRAGRAMEARDELAANAVTAASAATKEGYALEVLLPWSNFGVKPQPGSHLIFMTKVGNIDRKKEHTWSSWYPRVEDPVVHLRLADKPNLSVKADIVSWKPEQSKRLVIGLRTLPELIGKTIAVRRDAITLGRAKVTTGTEGYGAAVVTVPIRPDRRMDGYFVLHAAKEAVGLASPTNDIALLFPKAVNNLGLRFDPYVFEGTQLPDCAFKQPVFAEDLLGPYSIDVTYYDKDYNRVTTAEKPGRYGAIVEIKPKNGGRVIRRFYTLYRMPGSWPWLDGPYGIKFFPPKEFGVDPAVADAESGDLGDAMRWAFYNEVFTGNREMAIAVAGWSEMNPTGGKAPRWADASALDRQWWLTLKRKLSGADKQYSQTFVAPRPLVGRPATVLHAGTLAEAGMKPDAAERIDKLLQTWAADTDQAFAVMVARHGVIVLHKAYGMRDGQPMTTETKSWMASITKALSANLMWMVIDQGFGDLDDDVGKYFSCLRDVKVEKPLTIRHLYTHTSGFPNMAHWGDEMNDLEEVVSGYYPYLPVGQVQAYNGVGISLGGKIVEMITGEAIPICFHNHLLGPLGMNHTDVSGTYGNARSVPMDIAKVGQLMLNRGAYGNLRFYSEATFAKMLPQPLTKVLGRDTGWMTGIGLWLSDEPGLGRHAFGHGAASSATFIVDPDNELVLVMTRNAAGTNFSKYHPQFIRAIAEGIDK